MNAARTNKKLAQLAGPGPEAVETYLAEHPDIVPAPVPVSGETAASIDFQHAPRKPENERRVLGQDDITQHRTFIPKDWRWMAAVLAICATLGMAVKLQLAPVISLVLFVGAIGLILPANRLQAWERAQKQPWPKVVLAAALTIAVPMAMAGTAFALGLEAGAFDWRWGIAALISINVFSSTFLSRRVPLLFIAIMAIWAPIGLVDGSVEALSALAFCGVVMVFVARHQARLDRDFELRQEDQKRTRNRYRAMLQAYEESGQGWFWETDRRGWLTYISPTVARALSTKPSNLVGKPFLEIFSLGDDAQEGERTLTFHMSARSSFQELAVRAAVRSEARWWSVSGRPIYDSFHNFVGFRGAGSDLTEKRRSQERATRLARFDSLTGLANRFQMAQMLEKTLEAPQENQRECSVFLLDLDRFKNVNDTLGHPAGDALLKQVAERLKFAVGEVGQVGRLGGDEFQIIIPGRTNRQKLGHLAQEIIRSISQPYSIEGQRVIIGVSIGMAVAPKDGRETGSLIRNADLALYAAKDGGRGRFHFYSEDLHSAAEERSQLEQDLRDAITHGELELFYQPVVHTATERIAGFEALLRWNHPKKGWLSPGRFVPVAEDAGLISIIGEWAIRTACQALATWPTDVRCAVNVSALQFANPQLPAVISHAIAQAGIAPERLELEITESVFLNDNHGTEAMFAALKGVGVRLALDDFGTGYSSLGYLKKAPFDKIKIDQSFVRGATEPGSRNGAIIAAISSLAQALGMDTTAEGVETLDELDLVRQHGCSHVQGYIYDRPLSRIAASERLAKGLDAIAKGPRSARTPRSRTLRKVVLNHDGQEYDGMIRNVSERGVMIEGLWNVPDGTVFSIALSDTFSVTATSRWNEEDRMGVEFSEPLERGPDGSLLAITGKDPPPVLRKLRR